MDGVFCFWRLVYFKPDFAVGRIEITEFFWVDLVSCSVAADFASVWSASWFRASIWDKVFVLLKAVALNFAGGDDCNCFHPCESRIKKKPASW